MKGHHLFEFGLNMHVYLLEILGAVTVSAFLLLWCVILLSIAVQSLTKTDNKQK